MVSASHDSRLASQGVDLSAHSPDLLCAFDAYQLSVPRVLWINRQWFSEVLEIDTHAIDWHSVRAWLIQTFGYAVPLPGDSSSSFLSSCKTFFADRYGDDALAPHGGSGRVGISGSFQVKGIGPTPLVGRHADWLHNHGCMWLEEGIREALVSELIRAHFPVGSLPVVALIDTGVDATFALDSPDRRRTLLVRPSFYRPAHMQRAPMFVPLVGDRLSEQFSDARRTRDMAASLGTTARLSAFVEACGQQAGHAYFHRCFLGGMLSSNWTLDGRVADFGGITDVPNWDPVEVVPGLPCFGSESIEIEVALEAICSRICGVSESNGRSMARELVQCFRRRITASVEELADQSDLGRHRFKVGADGTLHSEFDSRLRRRFRFCRQGVQEVIWNSTTDPDSLEDGSIESLIDSLTNDLLTD